MRFLLFTLEYFPFKGGVANYYTNLVYHWPRSSFLAVLNNNNNELLSRRGFWRWRKSVFKLYHYVKKNKIDHVIVGHILPLGIAAFIVSKLLKNKYTVFLHGMDFSYATRNTWKRFITKIILKRADKIIAANSYTAKICSDFLGHDGVSKIKVVNPGARDFSDEKIKLKSEEDLDDSLEGRAVLFSLGRLVKRKGFDKTLEALKLVFEKYPDNNLVYIIAGKGPDEGYLKKVAQKELGDEFSDRVKFVGKISEAEKWSLLHLCDIFIMPSRNIDGDFEGFGIVYLEANLAKKPVIAGDSGGVRDAVENGINGLLVNPESPQDISKAILAALFNDDMRISLGEQGRKRVIDKFNWEGQIAKIFSFLNND
jgi:phosphatidyl-myo-inositol dimannoside synthase